jgi:hypothetical protein
MERTSIKKRIVIWKAKHEMLASNLYTQNRKGSDYWGMYVTEPRTTLGIKKQRYIHLCCILTGCSILKKKERKNKKEGEIYVTAFKKCWGNGK